MQQDSINWQGWNISLVGLHMKSKDDFIKEIGPIYGNSNIAESLWNFLNPVENGYNIIKDDKRFRRKKYKSTR